MSMPKTFLVTYKSETPSHNEVHLRPSSGSKSVIVVSYTPDEDEDFTNFTSLRAGQTVTLTPVEFKV
jgi:hypothetical protein